MAEFTPATDADLPAIREIYNHYVLSSTATFHATPVPLENLREFVPVGDPRYPSFVALSGGEVIGFCCLSPYKRRSAYDRTAELSVYLEPGSTGRGLGAAALARLEDAAAAAGIRVLVGTVCTENAAGLRLLERRGFERCGTLKRVGEKFGRSLDVALFQREL
jgi:phosphinothricin acetyltransferase